jgi:alpha-amylase/alpha-mannosidase (GH57 family)
VPLLLDLESAREAMPEVTLPGMRAYPGGEERVRWHMQRGLETFEHHFGRRPVGCWPSEGSVSPRTLQLMEDYGMRWAATGETVLANTLQAIPEAELDAAGHWLHRPYRLADGQVAFFFRDDGLSDAIGFRYSDWHADDAVANFVHSLEAVADAAADKPDQVVSVVLDGENAWEYYPNNGYYFLSALYRELAAHPRIELTTYEQVLEKVEPHPIERVVAGSWVYGTFSTWIGDADKNRGWEMLGDAKNAFDAAVRAGLSGRHLEHATEQLAICEGSDWCWWFGDYNPSGSVSDFERLYRQHLANLYQLIGQPPPEYLSRAFTHGGGDPATGGTMRQGQPARG